MTVRLGVVGCGSVFWTPYMTLIERLAREGRVASRRCTTPTRSNARPRPAGST